MMPNPGDVIGGKYRVVRLIGDGGMGAVYEAYHQLLETQVALKFLLPELARRPGLGSRFLQEARVSARIHSPHVTRVTDVDQTPEGSPYLVMELLHGESLQAALDRRRKLPTEQAVDFALQILSGLESAHAIGVVHRDLKPDNVFIVPATGGPLLKLIDFGIAKLRASTEFQKGLTRAGAVMGTPEYMAPEQLFAAASVDHRADLYSLGVILFEMLAGRRPADGDTVDTIVAAVVSGNVRRLKDLEPSLPPGLCAIVERSLMPDREARFATALEMRLALAPFAGALSHAGRLAASSEPMVHRANSPQPAQTGPAQVFDPGRAVPKTLPPEAEPAPQNKKGATQEVSAAVLEEALRASAVPGTYGSPNYQYGPPPGAGYGGPPAAAGYGAPPAGYGAPPAGYGAPPVAHAMPTPVRRRRSRAGLWVTLTLLGVLGIGGTALAIVFYRQHQPSSSDIAPINVGDPAAPATTVSALIDTAAPSANAPALNPGTPVGVTPSRPLPNAQAPGLPSTAPRAADAGAAPDAAHPGLPFPFTLPSGLPALPSSLPPLPSNFPALPKTFPTAFPTALPSGFPAIPGFPVDRASRPDETK